MLSDYMLKRRATMMGQRPPDEKKPPKEIAKVSEKKKKQLKDEKPQADLLEAFFVDAVAKHPGKCQNCGCKIDTKVFVFAKMTVAHVLPKRKGMFPSVATRPENKIYLCVNNGCHPLYDRSWEDAAKMPIWPLVVEQFKLVYPWIHSSEKKHLPDVLLQEVEPIN